MKLICDNQAIKDVIEYLNLKYEIVGKERIRGYRFIHEEQSFFYMIADEAAEDTEVVIVELQEEDLWGLDKFQSCICLVKKLYTIVDGVLQSDGDLCVYERRTDASNLLNMCSIEEIKRHTQVKKQLSTSDVYLLVPGKFEKSENDDIWQNLQTDDREIFTIFDKQIQTCIQHEYNSDFASELQRKCLGDVKIEIADRDGKIYVQDAVIGIVRHVTGICILEIMVLNCQIGGNKVLAYFCGNEMNIYYNKIKYSVTGFLELFSIRKFGKKRSMVFNYGEPIQEEIINALANEENPMGKIHGIFKKKVESEDIAQYDTAKVYCSAETMFEQCKTMNVLVDERLCYHVIEIFFVELVIFQDVAIEKVCYDIRSEIKKQLNTGDLVETQKRQEAISFDMVHVMRFINYEEFNYPTVRESAKRIAHDFEIDNIFASYENYKNQLTDMIHINERRLVEEQNNIKNYFLFLLSALAIIGTVGEIIYTVNCDIKVGLLSYTASVIVVAGIYGIYKLIDWIFLGKPLKSRRSRGKVK